MLVPLSDHPFSYTGSKRTRHAISEGRSVRALSRRYGDREATHGAECPLMLAAPVDGTPDAAGCSADDAPLPGSAQAMQELWVRCYAGFVTRAQTEPLAFRGIRLHCYAK